MTKPFISLSSASEIHKLTCYKIRRRGFVSGYIEVGDEPAIVKSTIASELWKQNKPDYLPKFILNDLENFSADITKSKLLFETIARGGEIEGILDLPDYVERLGERFEMLATRCDEADAQEIVSVDYDVMENSEMIMEDIWMRVSALSFIDDDHSLRFRFSFGMEGYDDVSEDFERQLAAAELCERLFPESGIITKNETLKEYLHNVVGGEFVMVERIIYFNAPNGGAQFHHDAEKGHLGVVYAQLSGQTFWFAMAKNELMDEIISFLQLDANLADLKKTLDSEVEFSEFITAAVNRDHLSDILDNPAHNVISILMNSVQRFFEQLVQNGFGYRLNAGDIILLPQESMKACAWHAVFCIGSEAGQALSYAIKRV